MLNQILFGIPLIKYALNNKSFKSLEKASLLIYFANTDIYNNQYKKKIQVISLNKKYVCR